MSAAHHFLTCSKFFSLLLILSHSAHVVPSFWTGRSATSTYSSSTRTHSLGWTTTRDQLAGLDVHRFFSTIYNFHVPSTWCCLEHIREAGTGFRLQGFCRLSRADTPSHASVQQRRSNLSQARKIELHIVVPNPRSDAFIPHLIRLALRKLSDGRSALLRLCSSCEQQRLATLAVRCSFFTLPQLQTSPSTRYNSATTGPPVHDSTTVTASPR